MGFLKQMVVAMPKKMFRTCLIFSLSLFSLSLGNFAFLLPFSFDAVQAKSFDFQESDVDPNGETRVLVALRVPAAQRSVWAQSLQIAQVQNDVLESVSGEDFVLLHRYQTVPGMVGTVTDGGLARLREHPDVFAVAVDMQVQATTLESAALIRADQARETYGVTGRGVVVAVIDSGIDTMHPDLADDIVGQHCFSRGGCPPDGSSEGDVARDSDGHGTQVAGIVTGRGTESPLGIAPDTDIIAVRVLDEHGMGWNSDVIAAIDWVVANQWQYDVKVINLSLGGGSYESACDAVDANMMLLANAVAAARSAGIMTVAAAGNGGQSNALIAPACLRDVVAVGSVYDANIGSRNWGQCSDSLTDADQITCFSNSGTMLDLLAPGAWIESAALGGGRRGEAGTSQAVPHVTAVVALLLEANPHLTPGEIESTLEATGVSIADVRNGYTVPRIDALAAVEQVISQMPVPTPVPLPSSTIVSGTVLLQGQSNHSGASVGLSDVACEDQPTEISAGSPRVVTAADGQVSLSLPSDHGYRCLLVEHSRYLRGLWPLPLTPGSMLTLSAGDLNGDGAIDIFDLTRVAAHYNTNDGATDLTGDGMVNLFDLTIIAGNYGKVGPIIGGQ